MEQKTAGSNGDTTVSAPTTTETGAAALRESGMCPVKTAYLCAAGRRISLDAEGRTRGMNRGAAREHSTLVTGVQRPTFEGETNFLDFDVLRRVKESVRGGRRDQKRGNEDGAASPILSLVNKDEANDQPLQGQTMHHTDIAPVTDTAEERDKKNTETSVDLTTRDTCEEGNAFVAARQSGEAQRERDAARQARARLLLSDKLILAPLTTVGNLPFRRICKRFGADVTMSEMAVVYNLNRTHKGEWALLRRHSSEDIFGIQIAVNRAQEAGIFARALEASGFSYDFLDINCGCPVEKMVGLGCGCGLWERKGRLREVVQTLTRAQSAPVTIKCRTGTEEGNFTLHRQIGEYAAWGATAVTVHGRTRCQRYTKLADWDYIETCAEATSLPVIGNGDILAHEDVARHRAARPHISSFMIGRGALIKPWIFDEIKSGQAKDVSSSERLEMLREFCQYGLAHWGADERGVMTTRRFLCEWQSFLHRYVPVALLEHLPQHINERPPSYFGRNDLETLMASDSVADWIRISEMLLGPVEPTFRFTPKHKSNSYVAVAGEAERDEAAWETEG